MRETALAGRETELATLRRCFEEAAAGEGPALLLVGGAGLGKTRLLGELVKALG